MDRVGSRDAAEAVVRRSGSAPTWTRRRRGLERELGAALVEASIRSKSSAVGSSGALVVVGSPSNGRHEPFTALHKTSPRHGSCLTKRSFPKEG